MGFFFTEPKEEKKDELKQKAPSHGVFGTIVVMFFGFLLMISTKVATLIIDLLGILARQALTVLDPRETENKTIRALKILIIVILICGPLIFIYSIPSIRDTLTLSSTHTINVQRGNNVLFPNRSYFVPEGERRVFLLEQNGNKKYVNYTGYKKNLFLPMKEDYCHLVTRGERVSLASTELPIYAAGFSNSVKYSLMESVGSLPTERYVWENIKNPKYLLYKRDELQIVFITYEKEGTWSEFASDFEKIPLINGGSKSYELKALYFEHAMVCY